jgi:putative Flp pilus-assembly TadE/G-like protein
MNQQKPISSQLMAKLRRAESGQAIVLMALVLVVLLAMLGLAIDGGGLYFLWRDAQNASDAAVLAASYARCTTGDPARVKVAGLEAAAKNGFENNGTSNTVAVYNPPISGPKLGDVNYVQVDINAKKPSYFIQLVYKGPLEVTTRAVGFCLPPFDPTTVPAIYAGAIGCPNANTISWQNSNGTIEGDPHSLFSNQEIAIGGGGAGPGNVISGDAQAVTGFDYAPQKTTWQDTGTPPQPIAPVSPVPPRAEDPLSLQLADYMAGGTVATRAANQGLYSQILGVDDDQPWKDFKSNGVWDPANGRELEGLYFVNGDVNIGSGVNLNGDLNHNGVSQGVTIIATGSVTINTDKNAPFHYFIDGLLVFSDYGHGLVCPNKGISVTGSEATWTGVFYAPHGEIQASLSKMSVVGAFIANTINVGGSELHLVYDSSILPPRPPSIQVAE